MKDGKFVDSNGVIADGQELVLEILQRCFLVADLVLEKCV